MHEFRPMSVSDILDTTFRLYRERFVTFLLIALVVYVPYSLLATLITPAQAVAAPASRGTPPQIRPCGTLLGSLWTFLVRCHLPAVMQRGADAQHFGSIPWQGTVGRRKLPASAAETRRTHWHTNSGRDLSFFWDFSCWSCRGLFSRSGSTYSFPSLCWKVSPALRRWAVREN